MYFCFYVVFLNLILHVHGDADPSSNDFVESIISKLKQNNEDYEEIKKSTYEPSQTIQQKHNNINDDEEIVGRRANNIYQKYKGAKTTVHLALEDLTASEETLNQEGVKKLPINRIRAKHKLKKNKIKNEQPKQSNFFVQENLFDINFVDRENKEDTKENNNIGRSNNENSSNQAIKIKKIHKRLDLIVRQPSSNDYVQNTATDHAIVKDTEKELNEKNQAVGTDKNNEYIGGDLKIVQKPIMDEGVLKFEPVPGYLLKQDFTSTTKRKKIHILFSSKPIFSPPSLLSTFSVSPSPLTPFQTRPSYFMTMKAKRNTSRHLKPENEAENIRNFLRENPNLIKISRNQYKGQIYPQNLNPNFRKEKKQNRTDILSQLAKEKIVAFVDKHLLLTTEDYIVVDGNQVDMAPVRDAKLSNLRETNRLCQRNVLRVEGPKYDGLGNIIVAPFAGRPGEKFYRTGTPPYLLPKCCNCCKKSVLGCQ